MEKKPTFLAWFVEDFAADGVATWAAKNVDTLIVCFLAAFGMTALAAFRKGEQKSDRRTLFYGLLATFILVGCLIWIADDYGIRKVFWPLISAGIGGASLLIIGAYMRFMEKVEEKLPDRLADAVTDRVTNAIKPAKE